MRLGHFAFASSHAPYAIATLRSLSLSSGNVNAFLFANAAFAATSSKLAPRIWILFSS